MYQLFEPARLGPMALKNRVARSATNEHLSEPDGRLTQVWADTLIELARNEVGLVISGHFTVDGDYRADPGQPVLDSRADPALLAAAAEGVHQSGGRLVIQLSHSGLKADPAVNGRPPKGPDDFTPAELDELAGRFVSAALRCKEAGLDGVQVHCAHGYLFSSFLNPEQNGRTDEYGSSLENRFRIAGRVLRDIRAACGPEFALLVKVDSNACGDLHRLLELVRDAGADGAEISGLGFNTRAGQKTPFFLEEALAAKDGVDLPLLLVGGIFSPGTAQAVLDAGIPFVSLCRALICQPDLIARWKAGEQTEARCLACNGCYKVYRKRPVRCVQHTEPIPQLSKLFQC